MHNIIGRADHSIRTKIILNYLLLLMFVTIIPAASIYNK